MAEDNNTFDRGVLDGIKAAENIIAQLKGGGKNASSDKKDAPSQGGGNSIQPPKVDNPILDDSPDKTQQVSKDGMQGDATDSVDKTKIDDKTKQDKNTPSKHGQGSGSNSKNSSGDNSSGDNSSGDNSNSKNSSGDNSSGDNSSGDNSSGDNSKGDNSKGDNSKGDNSKGDNSNGGNSSGDNSNGGNSSGGNSSGGNSSGDNSSGDNSKGDNSKGDNSNGDNSNGGNSNGGWYNSKTTYGAEVDKKGNSNTTQDKIEKSKNAASKKNADSIDAKTKDSIQKQGDGSLSQTDKQNIDAIGKSSGNNFVSDDARQWQDALRSLLANQLAVYSKWDSEKQSRRVAGAFGANRDTETTNSIAICIDCSGSMGGGIFMRLFKCIETFFTTASIQECDIDVYRWGAEDNVKMMHIAYTAGCKIASRIANGGRGISYDTNRNTATKDMVQFNATESTYIEPLCKRLKTKIYDCILICTDLDINDKDSGGQGIRAVRNKSTIGWVLVDTSTNKPRKITMQKARAVVAPFDKTAYNENRIICPQI